MYLRLLLRTEYSFRGIHFCQCDNNQSWSRRLIWWIGGRLLE